jgi:uncharacterized protein YqeY
MKRFWLLRLGKNTRVPRSIRKAGRQELADKELAGMAVIEAYLPQQWKPKSGKPSPRAIAETGATSIGPGRDESCHTNLRKNAEGRRLHMVAKRLGSWVV